MSINYNILVGTPNSISLFIGSHGSIQLNVFVNTFRNPVVYFESIKIDDKEQFPNSPTDSILRNT